MSKKLIGIFAVAILFAVVSAPVAKADGVDTIMYQTGGNTFVWQLPCSPTPAGADGYPGYGFTLHNIPVSVNGAAPVLGSFDFFSALCAGGFDLTFGSNVPADAYGPLLYMGWGGAPTFLTGTFNLADYGMSDSNVSGRLVIAGVPEPSSIGLLLIGFLIQAIGFRSRAPAARMQS
jgi:hypothetical protein